MNKKLWSLFLPLMLGVGGLEAGWVYQADEPFTSDLSDEEEEDFSETLGLIEDDLEEENLLVSEERPLPWSTSNEMNSKECFSLLEEHTRPKNANSDLEENFALDAHSDDFGTEEYFPSLEEVSSKEKSFLAERSREEQSPFRDKRKIKSSREKEIVLKKPLKKPQASTRKKTFTSAQQSQKQTSSRENSSKIPKPGPRKRVMLKEKKSSLMNRPPQRERLVPR